MAPADQVTAELVAQVQERVATLKRCYDEAEASNDELAELLRQSLARETDLRGIISALIEGDLDAWGRSRENPDYGLEPPEGSTRWIYWHEHHDPRPAPPPPPRPQWVQDGTREKHRLVPEDWDHRPPGLE